MYLLLACVRRLTGSIPLVFVLFTAATAGAEPLFLPLGDLAGGSSSSRIGALSADGRVVVGVSSGANGDEAFRWKNGVMVGLGDLPGGASQSEGFDVSGDGSVVVGSSEASAGTRPFRWENGVMSELAVPGVRVVATTISADGQVIGGKKGDTDEFFRLENGQVETTWGGFTFIDIDPKLSGDGSVAAAGIRGGEMQHLEVYGYPMRWEGGIVTSLTDWVVAPSVYYRHVAAVSSDGEILVVDETRWQFEYDNVFIRCRGGCSSSVPGEEELVTHPLGHTVHPYDASGDAAVVVGYSGDAVGNTVEGAFVYDPVNGYRYLAEVIQSGYGIDLAGWTLDRAVSVSSDGMVIVGDGTNPGGDPEAWLFAFDDSLLAPEAVPALGFTQRGGLLLALGVVGVGAFAAPRTPA